MIDNSGGSSEWTFESAKKRLEELSRDACDYPASATHMRFEEDRLVVQHRLDHIDQLPDDARRRHQALLDALADPFGHIHQDASDRRVSTQ